MAPDWVRTSSCESARMIDDIDSLKARFLEAKAVLGIVELRVRVKAVRQGYK